MGLGDPYVETLALSDFLKMSVDTNDEQLSLAVSSASRWLDGYCRRQFNLATTSTARIFDVSRTGNVLVDDIGDPSIAVATDTSCDGTYATSWASSDFQAQPFNAFAVGRPITELAAVGNLRFPQVFRRAGLVKVTAKWGWPAIPDEVKQATLIQAGHIYKRRESTEGVMGFSQFGPVRVGKDVDSDVVNLLAEFRYAAKPG